MDPFLDEEAQSSSGFDPIALLRAFWRRKMLFFVPFVLCLAMAGVAIKTMTPIFASSGQVLINFEGLNSSLLTDPSSRFGRTRNIDAMAFHEMDMLLTSPDFLERMVRELKLQEEYKALPRPKNARPLSEDEAIRRAGLLLDSQLTLKQDGVRLFRLEVRDPDPYRAFKLADHILDRFVAEYRASQLASSSSTREFMQNQLKTYKADLAAAETALNSFQAGMASDALANNPINAMNLRVAQSNLETVRERYDSTDARELAGLGQGMRTLLGEIPDKDPYAEDDIIQSLSEEMEGVGLELQLHVTGDREVADLENALGQLRVRLNTRIEELVSRAYSNLSFLDRNQISHYIYFSLYRDGTKRVTDALAQDIQEFRDFTSRQPELSTRLAELQQDVTDARVLVARIESEITNQTLNLEASMSEIGMQIKIRRSPRVVQLPVEPDKLKLTLMGVILSLGIGLGLVILAIFMDRSFTTVEDIERTLGVAILGTLPVIQDDHFERRKKIRVLRWVTIILGIIAVGAVGFLVVYPRLG